MAIVLTNISGRKHRVPLTTGALAISVVESLKSRQGRVQLVANDTWYYSSQDEGSTADNWLTVSAGQAMTFDTGSAGFSFYARAATGTLTLHIVEL